LVGRYILRDIFSRKTREINAAKMMKQTMLQMTVLFSAVSGASKYMELKTEVCSAAVDPGCDHICVVNPIYGALCNCNFGYKLYEDKRTCVLTKEFLEAEEKELQEDFAIPVTIICLVGGLVIFIMAVVTWYCVTRTPDNVSVIVSNY
jgi:hypothetical protein